MGKNPNWEVTAVVEEREDRGQHLRETLHCENAYGEFYPILEDAKLHTVVCLPGLPRVFLAASMS